MYLRGSIQGKQQSTQLESLAAISRLLLHAHTLSICSKPASQPDVHLARGTDPAMLPPPPHALSMGTHPVAQAAAIPYSAIKKNTYPVVQAAAIAHPGRVPKVSARQHWVGAAQRMAGALAVRARELRAFLTTHIAVALTEA